MLEDLRKQPYVASITDDASHSRQWVFRGRDIEGSRLEAQRDLIEERNLHEREEADRLQRL